MARARIVGNPLLGALLAYWEQKRGDRAMPRRRDIDPLDMPAQLLPHVQLIEIGAQGRLRLRLVGTAVVDAVGKDATGRFLDEAFGEEDRRFLDELYGAALRTKRPASGSRWWRKAKGPDLGTEWLATPLSDNGSDANMILAATSFHFARARTLAAVDRTLPPIEVL